MTRTQRCSSTTAFFAVDYGDLARLDDEAQWLLDRLFEWRALAEAERFAWAELQNRWHMAHGERVSPDLCGGGNMRL